MNPLDIIDLSYRKLPHLELGHWVVGFADAIRVHPDLQGEDAVPSKTIPWHDELSQLGNDFIAITNAAQSGDMNKTAERDTMRPTVELHPAMTINWLVTRSLRENNPRILSHLPLHGRAKPVKGNSRNVTTPSNPKAKHGSYLGMGIISCSKVPGAAIYHVQICQGDPTVEGSWRDAAQSRTCRGIEVTGLTPGEIYHFRIRCYGVGGYSPYSAVVSLRIL